MIIVMSSKFHIFTAVTLSSVCAISAVTLASVCASGCSTAPRSSEKREDLLHDADRALAKARAADPEARNVIDEAYGVAVFPKVGKGGVGVGGAYGKGVVYEQGRAVGYCDLTQGTVGLQLGGQTYTEIICFEDRKALDRFRDEDFAFSSQVSAVALEAGAGKNAAYRDGVAVFTTDEAGLMVEAALGGQKFTYKKL